MRQCEWTYTYASAIGTSHQRRNEGCQDYCRVVCTQVSQQDERKFLFAAVADGAGTAKFAAEGAKLTVRNLQKEVRCLLMKDDLHLTRDALRTAVLKTSTQFEDYANRTGNMSRDYASTLICVILTPDQAWHLQVGDGAAVFRYGQKRVVDFWPAKGEYGNETFFITDDCVLDQLHIREVDMPEEVTLLTDGLEMIALDQTKKVVHDPFYDSFYRVLCQREPGFQRDLSKGLEAWMQTELVVNRTDDDKSLVLISKTRMTDLQDGD